MRRINEVSRICCRTIIFKILLVSYFISVFFCTMKTLIIGYGFNNITIQIDLVINCKACVRLVQQQLLQLQFSFFMVLKA